MTDEAPRSETVRVTEVLRNEIIDGHRQPGEKLVERNLATELGVSRVPIREALKKLASEGLVTNRPNTWSTVRVFSPSDIADLNEVRTVFDVLAFELAAQRHTREGLARLEATMLKGRQLAEAGEVVGAHRCAAEFHAIVTELSGNELLAEIGALLDSRMRWQLSQHDDLDVVAAEHAELFEAIARRDQAQAGALAASHLRTSQDQHEKHSRRLARLAEDEAQGEGD
ncbi:GntR family transcriptional regulator [Brevibacterium sp. SMBL_HHYL_HB1]|uniref:GntR family transcriptional regulator n=1 Tax=Brevibacterium sp. SMBL_HHYL_HB1 TaxID=2777556 RepID=UPI001BA99E68|nr:GntR family transcriptional regulator [Brevibacterium sp. SMBL_HHYL_HB1]QUL80939.1 GntR family transcriptional regulator [Brevibacterium sp. SMBL_HHYL_HB1]